ncbi:MAG: preprotein translocase subunit SecG [Candidatus Woykebacteria bacterium RIFCSPHIGHO2_12_FULL_43_10]|uniref:Protein-export membrane protein SecG n=2 Tax=Candidatus Woykeibacteriota TaxID=1817899 RepID=A0A1G1WZ19_9BACT|nr:MAG: preprotein translocase subunit SecG [Candidatus Woykebacteria bacterium RIFCSPHIGHO2_01_FULL_43_29]OGY28447.1 MAG: preprotein translocase subunit SecG [Candidatus Woykebacteria bacterium RIFCSPHIGHO2_02_FULL_43_16b]OGY28586.1 MAG: preprotein translocase subunit SecG [Candidatus Woykebacteria bacterium RIFCSPHIGHO2_12_FULL_43_10]OGY32387.1 MAG: preprotein translocase subunit SecG [Candidatus Woykebacteria bacterium RIFCSPLOWO2_01_FULL_43_14]
MKLYLTLFQVILSVGLIFLVLTQAKGAGLSNVFGGEGGIYRTKRGFEKMLHYATIVFSILFFATSLVIVLYS